MGKEIFNIISDMSEVLNANQLRRLQEVLIWRLSDEERNRITFSNEEYMRMFLTSKKLEGCLPKTINIYEMAIQKMFDSIGEPMIKITTEHLRNYLVNYQETNHCGKTTVDNVRRILVLIRAIVCLKC